MKLVRQERLRRNRGISNSEKRIEHSLRSRQAVEQNAIRRQLDRETSRDAVALARAAGLFRKE